MALPPFPCLLFFDQLEQELKKAWGGWEAEIRGIEVVILLFADDITRLLPHAAPSCPVRAASKRARDVDRILKERHGLSLQWRKSPNVVVSPGNLVGGIF